MVAAYGVHTGSARTSDNFGRFLEEGVDGLGQHFAGVDRL
jgi:hypothetical protein